MLGRRTLSRAAIVGLIVAMVTVGNPAAAAPSDPIADTTATTAASSERPGSFVSLAPARVLDTRTGNGASGPVAADATISVQITGRGGVPASGVAAVALNVTETGASHPGFITVYPDGTSRPTASNLNFPAGDTRANAVTVKLGANGKISITNSSAGHVDLIADVAGYYLSGSSSDPGSFVSLAPSRVLDTRTGNGAGGTVAANGTIAVQVTGRGGVPASGVSAVVLNVTATGASQHGFVTVYPDGTTQPTASNLNFPAGDTRANLVTVKLSDVGRIALTNTGTSRVHLIADVAGYYVAGSSDTPGAFVSLAPSRVLDTRTGNGASGTVAANGTIAVQVTGRGGVPASGVSAVVLNVTATGASQHGFITVYPDGTTQPTASNLNFPAGDTRANLVTVKLGGLGKVSLTNTGTSRVHLIADVAGYYLNGWSPTEWIDPQFGNQQAVDCPTATFCVMGDYFGGVMTFDGSSWSEPVSVDSRGAGITSVSCTSPAFCVAVEWSGRALIFDGRAWSAPTQVLEPGSPLYEVSCPTATFCAAIGGSGTVVTFDGSAWSHPVQVDLNGLSSVSCATSTFCVGVSVDGRTTTFDGTRWSPIATAISLPWGAAVDSIFCATPTFCAAETSQGDVVSFDGTKWSEPVDTYWTSGRSWEETCAEYASCVGVNASEFAIFQNVAWTGRYGMTTESNISCATTTFCVDIARDGNVTTWNGSRWSAPVMVGGPRGSLTSVSCATTDFCTAVDNAGYALTFDGTEWSTPTPVAVNYDGLRAVSCVTDAFCVAAGTRGFVSRYDGASWSGPIWLGAYPIQDVSCPTTSFCMAVDDINGAYVFDGVRWSARIQIREGAYPEVWSASCVSATFCATLNEYGAVSIFNGTTWSYPEVVVNGRPGFTRGDISCASQTSCVAVHSDGAAAVLRGTTWTPHASIGGGLAYVDVSCATSRFCIATDGNGIATTFDGTSWSPPKVIADDVWGVSSVDCLSASFCATVFSSGHATIGRPPV